MARGCIVTGTDTGIGKTVLAAGIAARLAAAHGSARYWKPVQAGLEDETDAQTVARLAPAATVLPEAYRLATPCSPHHAAQVDGVTIDPARLALPQGPDLGGDNPLVVEGAGGVLAPLSDDLLYADLFARWGLPVVLAARTTLGTINHTLLSLEALRARGITVAGVAFIGAVESPVEMASQAAIARLGQVPILGHLRWLTPLTPGTLAEAMAGFDLEALL